MTAYELRISDWSSDVCSSDLEFVATVVERVDRKGQALTERLMSGQQGAVTLEGRKQGQSRGRVARITPLRRLDRGIAVVLIGEREAARAPGCPSERTVLLSTISAVGRCAETRARKIGRASCRGRRCQYV